MSLEYQPLAKMIDHALLAPNLTLAEIDRGIDLALAYDVASVCILPGYVAHLARRLKESTVKTSTVIGFPHGAVSTACKVFEAQRAIDDGCVELDMVVNISQVVSQNWDYIRDDIASVIDVAHSAGQKVKVIFENCYLGESEKIKLCQISSEVDADWVKTSTGFGSSGATHEDLKLMRKHSAESVQVKAAGGVRELDQLLAVRDLGVTRCGASATAKILDELRDRLGLPAIQTTDSQNQKSSY